MFYRPESVRKNGNEISFWIKYEPLTPIAYAKTSLLLRGFAYTLEFITLDCQESTISTESETHYNKTNKIIRRDPMTALDRLPIVPGSLGTILFDRFCS